MPLSDLYGAQRSAYFVIDRRGIIVGGGGIAQLPCDFTHIAELQRFVLLPVSGRSGYGRRLLDRCLEAAHSLKFRSCYVESSSTQTEMNNLLVLSGFELLGKPLRAGTNRSFDTYYSLNLGTR